MRPGFPLNIKLKFSSSLKYDLSAGLVVFLVALPLCLGIALASGAPLFSGIIAGVIGGLIIGFFSGSEVSVSGPAAGLTVIVVASIQKLQTFEVFLLAVAISGIIQVGFSILRTGFLANYIPNSVIKGMLAAIGIVIILKQIPHALGRDDRYEGDFDFFFEPEVASNTFFDIVRSVLSLNPEALLISLLSIALLLWWDSPSAKKYPWLNFVPAPLLVVILGACLNEAFGYFFHDFYLKAQDGHLVSLPVSEGIAGFFAQFRLADFSAWQNPQVYVVALTIALVGSIETLLSIEASDKLDKFRRISDLNKELAAQGLGNFISGIIGGLPITSVIVRSSANAYAGARTRVSTIFHGILLLSCVALIPQILNYIPLASLAAVLIVIGYKLNKVEIYKNAYKSGLDQFIPFVFTILGIVFIDLLTGVFIGFVLGICFVVRTNHYSAITMVNNDNFYLLRFNKDLTFINKTELKQKLVRLPNDTNVIIDGTNASWLDKDIYDVVLDFAESAKFKNIKIEYRHFFAKERSLQRRQMIDGKLQKTALS